VFRNEKPGPGRFRQFMQFDADTVGSASPAADAEICMMGRIRWRPSVSRANTSSR
jgi:histidyl-tRNA synthetase